MWIAPVLPFTWTVLTDLRSRWKSSTYLRICWRLMMKAPLHLYTNTNNNTLKLWHLGIYYILVLLQTDDERPTWRSLQSSRGQQQGAGEPQQVWRKQPNNQKLKTTNQEKTTNPPTSMKILFSKITFLTRSLNDYISMVQNLDSNWQGCFGLKI